MYQYDIEHAQVELLQHYTRGALILLCSVYELFPQYRKGLPCLISEKNTQINNKYTKSIPMKEIVICATM